MQCLKGFEYETFLSISIKHLIKPSYILNALYLIQAHIISSELKSYFVPDRACPFSCRQQC